MVKNSLVHEDRGILKLRVNKTLARVRHLFIPVLDRLKRDIGLDEAIQVSPGAWDDESLKITILKQLWKQFDRYRTGVPRSTAEGWAQLEEVDGNWADPPPDDAITSLVSEIQGVPEQAPEAMQSEEAIHIPDEVKSNFEQLMSCHIVPVPDPIIDETNASGTRSATADDDSDNDFGDKPDGFELLGIDGRSTRGQIFSIKSKHLPRKRKTYVSSGTAKPWIDNKCPWCSVEVAGTQARNQHQKRCVGKCIRCRDEQQPCHSSSISACEECKEKGLECERPDLSTLGLYLAGDCKHCGVWKRSLPKHENSDCPGRCQSCRPDQKCVKKGQNCERCMDSSPPLPCGDFQRVDGSQGYKSVCEGCGNSFSSTGGLEQHRKNGCFGKCTRCRNQGVACSRHNSMYKGPCATCRDSDNPESCNATWRNG